MVDWNNQKSRRIIPAIIGKCGLCQKDGKELRASHLMPKGIYKMLRDPGSSLVSVTPKVALETDEQVRAHFLCGDCEELLNSRGERWVVSNCYNRITGKFPLHVALGRTMPLLTTRSGGRVYKISHNPQDT